MELYHQPEQIIFKKLRKVISGQALTQSQLGNLVGLSARMICHYEHHIKEIPSTKLLKIAEALGVSMDDLLGAKDIRTPLDPEYATLWRRLKKAELLPKKDQKALLYYLDALLQKVPDPGHSLSFRETARRKIKNV